MKIITETINLSNAGEDPVHGDLIKITYSDGTSDTITFNDDSLDIEDEVVDRRVVSVASFLDRLNVNGKLESLYVVIEAGRASGTPEGMRLAVALDNVKSREFIFLDDTRLRPTLSSLGVYDATEIEHIFSDALDTEIPSDIVAWQP